MAATPKPFNLTEELLSVKSDAARLGAMQRALQKHAADVLWEAPGSRVGSHALGLASRAVGEVCRDDAQPAQAQAQATPAAVVPGPQISWAPLEAV